MEEVHLFTTGDGSHSLFLPSLNEQYHSKHGAIQESEHVFIRSGLEPLKQKQIDVLEIGFGTGLNAFLTCLWAEKNKVKIHYFTLEKYPLEASVYSRLNYADIINHEASYDYFNRIHQTPWEQNLPVSSFFILKKIKQDALRYVPEETADVIFFDAFGPAKQPEMWTQEVFYNLCTHLKLNGVMVTYAATGEVRRIWQKCGLHVERLQGPPGKREMLRGTKIALS